jgi:zinc/manganese transport system permease protein
MFDHAFLQHAFLAGTAVALAAGLVGYFLVLRAQIFSADALSHVAFTGAYAALAAGLDLRLGLFVATIGVALVLGALGRRGRPDDVVIGGVFAWILGLGAFFLSLYTTSRSAGGAGASSVSVLRGSIFGLSASRTLWTSLIALGVCAVILLVARPLLFATLDERVAATRGVPVRLLGYVFLMLVAVMTAEAAQVVGPLLTLGVLAAPAGAAVRLTTRPLRGMWIAAAIAVASVWLGLTLAYALPWMPPSFGIIAMATLAYVAAVVGQAMSSRNRSTAVAT